MRLTLINNRIKMSNVLTGFRNEIGWYISTSIFTNWDILSQLNLTHLLTMKLNAFVSSANVSKRGNHFYIF